MAKAQTTCQSLDKIMLFYIIVQDFPNLLYILLEKYAVQKQPNKHHFIKTKKSQIFKIIHLSGKEMFPSSCSS